ncbi:MAG: transposase [Terrimonas ferruginea]|nr:transposase [Terrimonas ferruginea]
MFRKNIYLSIARLQADLDTWLTYYNNERPHSGGDCHGKTPILTF